MNLLIRRRGRYGQTKRGWGKAFFSKTLTLILITLAAAGLGFLIVLCFGIRTKAVAASVISIRVSVFEKKALPHPLFVCP